MDSQWESVHRLVEAWAARMTVSQLVRAQELQAGLTARLHLEMAPKQVKRELHHLAVLAFSAVL